MVEKSIIATVKNYLHKLIESGIDVSSGVIFGSQAKGSVHLWSDIDLIVISETFDAMKNRNAINTLWRVAARTDSRIEPIPCGKKQWLEDDASSIIEYARREGTIVTV